jgi:hypothetical protein
MTNIQPMKELKKKFFKWVLNIKNKGAMQIQKIDATIRVDLAML